MIRPGRCSCRAHQHQERASVSAVALWTWPDGAGRVCREALPTPARWFAHWRIPSRGGTLLSELQPDGAVAARRYELGRLRDGARLQALGAASRCTAGRCADGTFGWGD
jgi:hypothetical protein